MLSDNQTSPTVQPREVIIKEFIDTTTINGLERLTVENRARRTIWTIILCATFACFGVHFYYMISNYLEYPTNTETSIKESFFEFPDVTICAKKPFDKNKVTKKELGIIQATNFWHYVFKDKFQSTALREIHSAKYGRQSFLAFSKEKDIYLDIMQHIHYCSYNAKPCKESDFSVIHLPDRLNCITFHPDSRNLISAGRDFGLNIFLDTGPGFHVLSDYEEILVYDGYELTIHSNGTLPDLSQQSFTIQKGKSNDISLTMGSYEKVSTPINTCKSENDWEEWVLNVHSTARSHLFYHKSRATCKILRDQIDAIKECKCWRDDEIIPWNHSVAKNPADYPLCHKLPEHFFYNEKIFPNGTLLYKGRMHQLDDENAEYREVKKRAICLTGVKRHAISGHINNCDHICQKKYHMASFSNIDYQLDFPKFLNLYEEYFFSYRLKNKSQKFDHKQMGEELENGNNLMFITVHAVDLDVIHTRESLAYPLSNFFSDFGGNIGLWIGCTVITLAEIIELIFRLVLTRARQTRNELTNDDLESVNLKSREHET